ncbi:peptidyl-prolyl cis-trans isomerase C [Cohaesibacter sp. ES.047]|uniref:nitrogen fixation protein NifM n=1 Tax=Cohaesibacter sp. ES.047 TaxID=1798205 RepID=UPI000BB8D3BD|nr:nitrogen fixation protein NifM [Cohaesibacter sp. ES.047]SNY92940.1 peptidyl-prolyl cis-trans isomerase C [Cohaesibacter sp. ES.047]
MNDAGLLAHHLMRAALSHFECRYDELAGTEKAIAEENARRSLTIEAMVLKSPEARDIHIPDPMLDRAVENVRARYGDKDEFSEDLRRNALTEEILRDALRRELQVDAVLEKVAAEAAPATIEEARDWYDRYPEKFSLDETRAARQILITINDDYPENIRAEAARRISGIYADLDGSVAQFGQLALRHSECPSALEEGALGRIGRGQLFPELDDILFGLAEGTISEVIETSIGYHILLCEAVYPAQSASFEEAAPKIIDAMNKKRKALIQKRWMSGLMRLAQQGRSSHAKAGFGTD